MRRSLIGERDKRWSSSISLVIGNDFDSIILPDTDTGVGSTEVDTDTLSSNSLLVVVGHVCDFVCKVELREFAGL